MSRLVRPGRSGTPWDYLVVGLGNPGSQYESTLHNVGFAVLDLLVARLGDRFKKDKERALVCEARMSDHRVALGKPQTFMNRSGEAVAPLVRRYGIEDLSRLVIVHDELDLEPGRLKVKSGGGLAGHNGLRSLRDHLGTTDFTRVRIGVGKPPGGPGRGADFVLGAPSRRVRDLLEPVLVDAADAVEAIVDDGVDAAMARFNAG